MQNKTQIRLKFYMNKLYKLRKSVEAQEFFCMPSYDCFTFAEEKLVERKLRDLGILKLVSKGGEWNYEKHYFEKNKFTVDWNQLDVEYNGWMRDVPFVDIYREWKSKPISAGSSRKQHHKYAKLEDIRIDSHINRRLREGVTPADIEEFIKYRYPLISEIERIQKKVSDRLVTNAHCHITLEIKGDSLVRIGFRPYQDGFNIKKGEKKNKFLNKFGLHSNPNGDIKSEIPRVTRMLHTGEWKPFSFDFYSHYLGKEEIPAKLREMVKAQAMPMYFTKWSSPASFANRQYIGLEDKYKGKAERMTRRILEMMKEGFDREVGKSYDSLIFYYTSALEHFALEEVYDRYEGKLFQIFDEIYTEANIPDMEEIYKRAALKVLASLRVQEEIESKIKSQNFKPIEEEEVLISAVPDALDSNVVVDGDVVDNVVDNVDVVNVVVDDVVVGLMELSLVSKMSRINTSSSSFALKFENPEKPTELLTDGRKNNSGTVGRSWHYYDTTIYETRRVPKSEEMKQKLRVPKSEEMKQKLRIPKSEEMKQKLRVPKSEEMKQKLRIPKSEEAKAKMSSTHSESLNKQVEFVRKLMQEPAYINKSKKRAKQQYIDAKIVEKFGDISSTTLTKIRKLATSASKE